MGPPGGLSGLVGASGHPASPRRASLLSPTVAPAVRVRTTTLGFRADKPLAPGVQTQIKVYAQRPFRGERLIISDDCKDATVHSIMVGTMEQLVGPPVAGAIFSPTSTARIQMDTAAVAQAITLTVSRPNGGAFTAAIVGSVADDGSGIMPEPVPFVEPLMEVAALAMKEMEEAYEPGVTLDELTGQLRGDD